MDQFARNVLKSPAAFVVEVVMVGDVGVEVGTPGLDHHLAQQAGFGELMQAVVDGGQRDAHVVGHGLGMQLLGRHRSEEHTSELQSLMRISYAVFCLKKKKKTNKATPTCR